jgi:hypothetical protein
LNGLVVLSPQHTATKAAADPETVVSANHFIDDVAGLCTSSSNLKIPKNVFNFISMMRLLLKKLSPSRLANPQNTYK